MEYQKILCLLDNATAQPIKFRTRKWVEINDKLRKANGSGSQMSRTSFWDYSDVYIIAKGTITVVEEGEYVATRKTDRNNKKVFFKYCASFTDCISETNNIQVYDPKDLHNNVYFNRI